MGFKVYPTVRFEEIDIKDEVQMHRVVTRLLEIGILTPEQGIEAMKTGIYPNSKDIEPAQENYLELRRKGMYNPLVGGIPVIEDELVTGQDVPGGDKVGQKKAGRPHGTTGIPKQNTNASLFSRKEIQAVVYKTEDLQKHATDKMLEKLGKKKLSKEHGELIAKLCESIILAKDKNMWKRTASACISDFTKIEKLSVIGDISSLASEHELELYSAALLYHSK